MIVGATLRKYTETRALRQRSFYHLKHLALINKSKDIVVYKLALADGVQRRRLTQLLDQHGVCVGHNLPLLQYIHVVTNY